MGKRSLTVPLDDERYEDAQRRAQRALAGARSRGGRRWKREDLHAR